MRSSVQHIEKGTTPTTDDYLALSGSNPAWVTIALVLPSVLAILIFALLLRELIANCRTDWKAKKADILHARIMEHPGRPEEAKLHGAG